MAAQVLGAVGNLFAGVYLDQMSKWVWLGLYIPTQTLANGPFVMTTYSFIADNSTPRSRQISTRVVHLDVEEWSEELLRQLSYMP